MSHTVLTIEDDSAIRKGIVDALSFNGYQTLEAADGKAGMALALRPCYDLLLLDLMLPHKSGLEVLHEMRQAQCSQAVIILTAQGEEQQRVKGLQLGADDYVVKPFSIKELLARIGAVLRRAPQQNEQFKEISLPGGTIHFSRQEIHLLDGLTIRLSEKETKLFRYLITYANRIVTREELLSSVWGLDPKGINTRTIDMHIARLREKIDLLSPESSLLTTVHGKGYMFSPPEIT
ncbi:MAG: response regulator transcription factor [Pirellulaceae bacterium]|nr:response regulator transcription factor [Pirellulaceae bacterium]